jgi:hypothetical protein
MRPTGRRLGSTRRADLISRETRDADVVLALEDHLDIARLEARAATQLGELAGRGDEVVDEIVCDLKEDLNVC